jgi:centrosomal protein CEP152
LTLQQELQLSKRDVCCLQEKLNFQNIRDEELKNLKSKAEEFENLIRESAQISGKNACPTVSLGCQTPELSDISIESNVFLKRQETKIREEIAQIFASEMKKIQKDYYEELEITKLNAEEISKKLEQKSKEINVRNEQLNLMKFTVLEERNEFCQRMKEIESTIQLKQEEYARKIEDFLKELDGQKILIAKERKEFLMREKIESSKNSKLFEQNSLLMTKMKDLSKKYHSAKSTASNYKKYSEEKEKHFRDQYEHTKSIYVEELKKIDKKNKEMIQNVRLEYQNEIESLKKSMSSMKYFDC